MLAPLKTRFGLGFMLTQPMIPFGPNPRSFGHPGAGGSIAFADPDAKLPEADRAAAEVLCLPMGHYQTPDVTDRVIDAVRRAV